MNGQNALFGKQIVHHGEHQLLYASAVSAAKDNSHVPIHVHCNDHVGCVTESRVVAKPSGILRVIEFIVGRSEESKGPVFENRFFKRLFRAWPEHVVGEKSGERFVGNYPDWKGKFGISPYDPIRNEELFVFFEYTQYLIPGHVEGALFDGEVIGTGPVYVSLTGFSLNENGVLGTSSG